MRVCPQCGEENPDRARFCLACAAQLDHAGPEREVRKTVTVVFCDVVRSTAVGESLDPESLRRVMSRWFEAMRTIVERHGGTVEKFVGDAVMAVFGVPTLHEDDALRAVRAAAEMREALANINADLERDFGLTLQMRTGVNTGEVVAGTAERLATGDAVVVAKRLEEAAQSGEILLGDETRRLVRDAIRAEPLEAAAKGKDPLAAHRLLELLPEAAGRARRLDAPMVGRERERRRLRDAFEQAAGDRSCQLFTVLGAAGVGKSRLTDEFVRGVAGEATIVRGRCLSYGEGITFWPLAEAVREAAGFDQDEPPDELRRRIVELLGDEDDAELVADRIAATIGIANGVSASDELFWAARKLFEALARRRPLVAVFDDLHWAEPTFLDVVEHVADWSRDAPILLLCLARPELLDARPAWGGGKLNATTVLLEPLSAGECERLLDNLLGEAGLVEEARVRVVDAADGNPLFVEEMLAVLIEDGLLERRNGTWAPTADLAAVSVPPTIQALLAARLDRLMPDERAVIERGSVEGKLFHLGAVVALSGDADRTAIASRLRTLVRKELIRPDRASFQGDEAFQFRHLLLRDAAYEALPKEQRAELHERFATWLEEKGSSADEILGYHLEQAFRYREQLGAVDEKARRLAERAAERLASAGRGAESRGDAHAAQELLQRAVSLVGEEDPKRLEYMLQLAGALAEMFDWRRAQPLFADTIEQARLRGERRIEARARLWQAWGRIWTDPQGAAEDAAREAEWAIPILEDAGDDEGLAFAWELAGTPAMSRGRMEDYRVKAERALLHAQKAADEPAAASIHVALTIAAVRGPMPLEAAIEFQESAVEFARVRGMRRSESRQLAWLAVAHAAQGRFDEARELVARATAIADDLGQTIVPSALAASSEVEALAGRVEAAEPPARRAYEYLGEQGDRGGRSMFVGTLAELAYRQRRNGEALRLAEHCAELAASDDIWAQIMWRTTKAKALARTGKTQDGESLAREAVRLADETDLTWSQGDTRLALAEVLQMAGRVEDAAEAAEEALRRYEDKGVTVMAEKARDLLAVLSRA